MIAMVRKDRKWIHIKYVIKTKSQKGLKDKVVTKIWAMNSKKYQVRWILILLYQ